MVFTCEIEQRDPEPFGFYLMRKWLVPGEVLYMHTKSEFKMHNDHEKSRTSVSGDPSNHSLNVTISELTANDTDHYYCLFIVENPSSEDDKILGKTEFFLLVNAGECFCLIFVTPTFYLFLSRWWFIFRVFDVFVSSSLVHPLSITVLIRHIL